MATLSTKNGISFIVDDEDVEFASQFIWSTRQSDHIQSSHFGRTVFIHRLLMGLTHMDKKVVDHINGNPLDNRKCNLRVCTIAENLRNRGPNKGSVGFKNVRKCATGFRVTIMLDNKQIRFGVYSTEIEAAQAADLAAIKYHKDFAWLNFPRETYDLPDYKPPAPISRAESYFYRQTKTPKSGHKNISLMTTKNHYRASLMIRGKKYVIGQFKNIEDAKIALENFKSNPDGPYQEHLQSFTQLLSKEA